MAKFYGYENAVETEHWRVLSRIKALVDPACLMNPGALGLR
jgi:FAD/FMN-containing dehydrogenase